MTIFINRSGDVNSRVEPPIIQITGIFLSDGAGGGNRETRTYDTQHEVVSSDGLSVRTRDVDVFRGSVNVAIGGWTTLEELNPSETIITRYAQDVGVQPNLAPFSKASSELGAFTGEQPGNLIHNQLAYVYYTLNGKDPRQTKANLYTKAFSVRQNASGTDNYILKARVYINGVSSVVRKIEFRIANNQGRYRDVNRIFRG